MKEHSASAKRRCGIFRAISYSILLFVALMSAYLYFSRRAELPAVSRPEASRSSESAESPPQAGNSNKPGAKEAAEPLEVKDLPLNIYTGNVTAGAKAQDDDAGARAREKIKEGDYRAAISLLKEIAGKEKGALFDIGVLYFKLGDYDNAITFLEDAAKHNGGDFLTRKALAFSYYMKDDFAKSLHNAEAGLALKNDPELRTLFNKIKRERASKQSYIKEGTHHFKVVFDGYEHGGISRKVLGILEDAYKFVGSELDYFPEDPVTVILYTGRDFFDTTMAPEWAGGAFDLYDGKIRVPVRGAEGQEELLKKVLFHEYSHAVVHSISPGCPLWINEGLAEYFSEKYPKKVGQVIPLRLLETSFSWIKGDKVFIAYWESYSAVSYLIDRYGLFRIKKFLLSHSRSGDLNGAFDDAFSTTYNDFIAEWGKK